MNFLSQQEKDEQLITFNETTVDFIVDGSIIELIKEQARIHPEKNAIVGNNLKWTYSELDKITNQLAHCLVSNYHVQNSDFVGVKLNNDAWAIISLIGIMKAGATYVPIDPDYPASRKRYILNESNIKVLITNTDFLFDDDGFDGTLFAIDVEFEASNFPEHPVALFEDLNRVAYVIYTSGSTGDPKGVMISHKSLANYLLWAKQEYAQTSKALNFGFFSSLSFDLTITSIYLPLITGGSILLFDQGTDVSSLLSAYSKSDANAIKLTPAHVSLIGALNVNYANIEVAIVGGDALTAKHIEILKKLNPKIRIYNEYGPTEATVGCIVKEIESENDANSIGKPIGNTQVYLLSSRNELQPIGVKGEICISGDCLALGYLNKPDQTAEKFIDHPFIKGKRLYKTGDLAKWQSDGNMIFIGREDYQVKINGRRIELGEIEQSLTLNDKVEQVIVIAREIMFTEEKELIAYLVGEEDLNRNELIDFLKKSLPDYMIPSRFILLDEFPLTSNGKVDRKALLDQEESGMDSGIEYVAPTTDKAKALVEVCEIVLKQDHISVKDSFYNLGGDSIKSIQVVARLRQYGFSLKVEHILKHPILEELAGLMDEAFRAVEQTPVTGQVELTPIQKWFFESPQIAVRDHFNQSVLLHSKIALDDAALEESLLELIKHHDALRMAFQPSEIGWQQINQDTTSIHFRLELHDLTKVDQPQAEIVKLTEHMQASMSIVKGDIFKAARFRLLDGDRLVIIVHHLVVDGVSWRILLEDLGTLYAAISKGKQPKLPEKSDSFKTWALEQKKYATSNKLQSEKPYWNQITGAIVDSLPQNNITDHQFGNNAERTILFSKELTESLKTKAHQSYGTEVNDVLLTALGLSIKDVFSCSKILVEIEGHGREDLIDGVDITRTIGWFTTMYPFVLDTSNATENIPALINIKDDLRRVPQKGIGYGILNYLAEEGLSSEIVPQIRFNYLGDFNDGSDYEKDELFTFANENVAPDSALENSNTTPLDVAGIVVNGALTIFIRYSDERFLSTSIDKLAASFEMHLQELVDELSTGKLRIITPSDLTFKGLTVEELNNLNREQQLEDVYQLSPLQKGIYFHWLTNTSTSLYLEQTSFRIRTHNLPIEKLKRAYDLLVQRHAILRTNFTNDYAGKLLQVVWKKVESNFKFRSIKGEDNIDLLIQEAKLTDLNVGFNLNSGSQMRLEVIEIDNDQYEFLWSHHHILMDGWCISLLMEDFNKLLEIELKGGNPNLPSIIPYSNYIKWLAEQNEEKGLDYWKNYLADYNEIVTIPFASNRGETAFLGGEISFNIEGELFQRMDNLCNELEITLNSFIRSVWGYLLARYNNSNEVVFGAVVSGRPPKLSGVEEIVGLFSNTIPVKVTVDSNKSAKDVLMKVHADSIECAEFHFLNLGDVQSQSEIGADLINHVVLFQNYALRELDGGVLNTQDEVGLHVESVSSNVESNFDFNLVVSPQSDSLKISLKYNSNNFANDDVQTIADHLATAVKSFIEHTNSPLSSLIYITGFERNELLNSLSNVQGPNDEDREAQNNQTLIHAFKRMVECDPQKTALIVNDVHLTYLEIERLSDQLAIDLVQRYAISREDLIGIQLNRNEWMIVAILGVLKSGGAFVPIDPAYPSARKEYMIKDSALKVLITESDFIYDIDYYDGDLFAIDVELELPKPEEIVTFHPVIEPDQLAYVIYTSGSTGNPKGVMVEHRSIFNTITAQIEHFGLDQHAVGLQFASLSFDASISELFIILISGGTLCVANEKERHDPELLMDLINENRVSIATLPPSYLSNIDFSRISSLKKLITAGEAAVAKKAFEFLNYGTYYNAYGPTETAICGTIYTLNNHLDLSTGSLPIGRPISNASVFIVSKDEQLMAKGVIGEICIGGAGVARGYLNNQELTAEKFIKNPFVSGDRLYRTGDLGRWLPDGNLEFIGRKDDQVKVKGYRVELGEIEAALRQNKKLTDVAVLAERHEQNGIELVAYVVSDLDVNRSEILSELGSKLPTYMWPARFVHVTAFPLTPSGKVNKKELPSLLARSTETVPTSSLPKTEKEIILAKVWSEVLKREKIGVRDSFYSLGGDSIKSIQVTARLKQEGYTLKVEHILKTPTIADLAGFMQKNTTLVNQIVREGAVALTPIQRWFFESEEIKVHSHYNQSLLLRSKDRIDENVLKKCLKSLSAHHDALRLTFKKNNEDWQQFNLGAEVDAFELEIHDLSQAEAPAEKLREIGEALQRKMNLEKGNLAKAVLFKMQDGDRLGLILHHLITDGVSWRILIEDLLHLFEQYTSGLSPNLPLKTNAFMDWANALSTYAESDTLLAEKGFWESLGEEPVNDLPVDIGEQHGVSVINAAEFFRLNEQLTEQLKTKAHHAYRTEMNDILLTAFASAIKTVFGNDKIALNMEGHGREDLFENSDVSRTIGWFTSVYPVVLELPTSATILENLICVKETLRKIPKKGIGYGILKYMTIGGLEAHLKPQITFNYLGEFGDGAESNVRFDYASESLGEDVSEQNQSNDLLNIDGRIEKGELLISLRYSESKFHRETIQHLSQTFQDNLKQLIANLADLKTTKLTPSDLTFGHLTSDELGRMNVNGLLEDAYELSPLQQGIFFHWLSDRSSEMYTEQTSYRIKASNLKSEDIKNAYQALVNRYDILRTSFTQSFGGKMLQIVYKEVPNNFSFHQLNGENPAQEVQKFRTDDLKQGFDLTTGSQMRLKVIQLASDEFEFIWSHHHILMDGWCISILINDFNRLVRAGGSVTDTNLPPTRSYSNYISWLSRLDQSKSIEHWSSYLNHYSKIAEVPFSTSENAVGYTEGSSSLVLNSEKLEVLDAFCAKLSITKNSFIQGVWGYLLAKYNASNDVIFGAVVSGRPAELEGVEQMVGLFINTIPVRVKNDNEDTPESLLMRVQNDSILTAPFHYMNLAEVQAQSEWGRDLINHIILFENYAVQQAEVDDAEEWLVEAIETYERTNYDFTIIVRPSSDQFEIKAVFNQDKFDKNGIDRLMLHFEKTIEEFMVKSSEPLAQLQYLPDIESQLLLSGFNQTSCPYQSDKTIIDLIDEQVRKTPDQIALSFEATNLTYKELSDVSNQLGHYLKETYHIQPDELVAIKLPRTEWLLIAILGVLKSGGGYIPVGSDQPEARLNRILDESNVKLLLDSEALDKFKANRSEFPSNLPLVATASNNLAYVIFTSGSSGKPKGVMVEHRNVTNFFEGMSQIFGREAGVFLAMTNFTFDISVLELLWTVSNGYKVVIQKEVKEVGKNDPYSVIEQIKNHAVTHIQITPSLGTMLDQQLPNVGESYSLKTILIGGEPLPKSLVDSLYAKMPEVQLFNMYGPTETTIWSTVKQLERNAQKIEIGYPIANTNVYILDTDLCLSPVGVAGEIFIGGAGVVRGYIESELTAQSFIENPFSEGERIYRTGDYGMWLPNGSIVCLGRKDLQIKIRGFRIELGEIEEALRSQENVNDAAVLLQEHDQEKLLVAYLTSEEGLNANELRTKLKSILPEYMLPNQFIQLPQLPLNSSGKIDRGALKELEGETVKSGFEFTAPKNDTEQELLRIWQELLNVEKIGTQDDFFVLGGHSLKATQLIIRIEEKFKVKLDLHNFLDHPTISKLAQDIGTLEWLKAEKESPEAEEDELII